MSEMVLPVFLYQPKHDRIDVFVDIDRPLRTIEYEDYVLFVDPESEETPAVIGFGITCADRFCRRHRLSVYTMLGEEFFRALKLDQRYRLLLSRLDNIDGIRQQLQHKEILH